VQVAHGPQGAHAVMVDVVAARALLGGVICAVMERLVVVGVMNPNEELQ
jgi:hypothetical protein